MSTRFPNGIVADVVGDITGDITGDIVAPLVTGVTGAGVVGTGSFGAPKTYRREQNGSIVTIIKFDLTGLGCVGTAANDVIGLATGGVAYIGRYTTADYGIVYKAELSCLETPSEGTATITGDIDIATNASALLEYDDAGGASKLINGGSLTIGQTVANLEPGLTANDYFYIVEADTAGTTGVYDGGQFILTLWGHAALD